MGNLQTNFSLRKENKNLYGYKKKETKHTCFVFVIFK